MFYSTQINFIGTKLYKYFYRFQIGGHFKSTMYNFSKTSVQMKIFIDIQFCLQNVIVSSKIPHLLKWFGIQPICVYFYCEASLNCSLSTDNTAMEHG